jgi:nucleoside-diphosphate-sugar epimerase
VRVRVLVLGGTGSIGAAVVRELVRRGHAVVALTRSDASARKISKLGAHPLKGDIKRPKEWLGTLPALAAVIHAASDFSTEVAQIDRRLLDALLPHLAALPEMAKFLYTGGCWLFGATGENVATEATPLNPLPADAWWVTHMQRIFETSGIEANVIHPAMVYEPDAGVFSSFARDAAAGRPIRVVAGESVRWPLVHSHDLADLYALVLEKGVTGESYIGSAIEGLSVGRIARAFAARFGARSPTPLVVSTDQIAAELGEYARGFALDQQLSGLKARSALGWRPQHLDPESEIASLALGQVLPLGPCEGAAPHAPDK